MADEFDTYIQAIVTKLKTISTFAQVTDYEPISIGSHPQAAVLMDTGEAKQRYTQKQGYYDTVLIRCYVPIGADPKTAEQITRQLWTDIVSVFTGDVDVGATTVLVGGLRYDTGYMDVAGVLCRILDVRPSSTNILTTAYA